MNPAEQLRAAKALIDTPDKWTKGVDAAGPAGKEIDENSEEAVCFCANGAILYAACEPEHVKTCAAFLEAAVPARFDPDPSTWDSGFVQYNDHPATTHADIMALFDRAIALADQPA